MVAQTQTQKPGQIKRKMVIVYPHACGAVEIYEFEVTIAVDKGKEHEVSREVLSKTIVPYSLIYYDRSGLYIQGEKIAKQYNSASWVIKLEPILD